VLSGSLRRARGDPLGGAVNSPHLLQISGIGPADYLQSIGVEVVHDLPGVGGNLSDHYVVRVSHRVTGAMTINQLSRGVRVAREALRWATIGNGALTFGVTAAMVFARSARASPAPTCNSYSPRRATPRTAFASSSTSPA